MFFDIDKGPQNANWQPKPLHKAMSDIFVKVVVLREKGKSFESSEQNVFFIEFYSCG